MQIKSADANLGVPWLQRRRNRTASATCDHGRCISSCDYEGDLSKSRVCDLVCGQRNEKPCDFCSGMVASPLAAAVVTAILRDPNQERKSSLNIKFLGGIFLGHPGPRRRDIPDKNFMQVAFFCCFRQGLAGMSRDLGRDVPDLEKLYARKLWADFSYPTQPPSGLKTLPQLRQ